MLMVQQRADNKRIFGGWVGLKAFNIGTYARNPARYVTDHVTDGALIRGKSWMFRISPTSNKIEFAEKYRSSNYVYQRSDYMMTWGAGHDYVCNNNGHAYSNFDYGYKSPHPYGSGASQSWLNGGYQYNCKNDAIEIYHTEG